MCEMKPCPFCGASVDVWRHEYPSGNAYYEPIALHEAGCILEHVLWCADYEAQEKLEEAWNRRSDQ